MANPPSVPPQRSQVLRAVRGQSPPRYRQFPELTRAQVIRGEVLSGFMWFWILWQFWHNSDMVLGHFPYPDPSAWTDEELGIPPDDEE
ncbi:PREDICTED: NADH dehydrogenase [ubiquinone] 1 beta subcomplex subunit 2, mitochondrial [Ficedula albicollis]|uniref:NADH dehydrogenase [ubiquinone] 1 beta subcomplex subunit 2, mitochondrial n=1 Tax=Ficedula albicollis TaxID=59894 RepID=UPI0003597DAD|nr:PREDICTED: NADH dehydrogenase [ubiquinone] 1 beta subcomplex subunit 2, mitochondrial [Ficedula albicollis]